MMRVGDLVEIPAVRTVIQLKDLQDDGLRQMILQSFVVTGEVSKSLEMILASLAGKEGRGIFLKGHFGSGKSHFLSLLSIVLRDAASWDILLAQEPSLNPFRGRLQPGNFLVIDISLIQHRGSEFLEDIFLKAIGEGLSRHAGRSLTAAGSRHEIFQEIRRTMRDRGFSKLVLLVDELSEFLRSKTDAHAYQEDVRFLQYLGEEALAFPLWIVASLQEWIEETGEINQDTFNKIKDRYPIRISLGRSHIEELVSHRLIRHREGADEEIGRIFQALRRYFPLFQVDEARFSKLYPVHPATITLLDRLRPLFSEHRGIVDFIHFRLKGDVERGIPSFLDRPAQELLGPAAIFDHFIHRIRETAETQPFVDKVYEYYLEETPRLFADPEKEQVALEAVKLLILLAVSPVAIPYKTKHLAEMILFRVTDLEADYNYHYLRDILQRLTRESPYLSLIPGKSPLEDQFSIKLQPDLQNIMVQKIRQKAAEIFSGDRRLFDRLLLSAESLHLPFSGWAEQPQQRVSLLWEYTRRQGICMLRPMDEISAEELERMAGEWRRTEEDFYILVAPTYGLERQFQHLRENLLPVLRAKFPGSPFLFWMPAAIPEEEEGWMKQQLSALLLMEGDQREFSESRHKMKPLLEAFLKQGGKQLGDILNKAYFNGLLLWEDRQTPLSSYGYLSQDKFIEEFIPPLLARRFPKHHRVHPFMEALAPTSIPALLHDFFLAGRTEIDERTRFGLRTILDNLLKPMGLVKKKGNQYVLHADPRDNELVEGFLSLLEKGPQPQEDLYWAFRKGDYGLLKHQFDVLALALLFSGNILAFQGQRKKGLEDISRSGLQGITAYGRGEILGEAFRKIIPNHPLIPEKWRKGTLTLPAQETLWNDIKARMVQEAEALRNLLQRMLWASSFQAFMNLPWESFRRDAQDVLAQWEEVKTSLPPREGLERFLAAFNTEPFLAEKLARLKTLGEFFEEADKILFVYQYLSDPRLSLPDGPAFQGLQEDLGELKSFFEAGGMTADRESIQDLLRRFEEFRDRYIRVYVEAHQKARSGEQFRPYEQIRHSRRYQLLEKLDQLEMISVRHDFNLVNNLLSGVIFSKCEFEALALLQNSPVCRCGFELTQENRFTPVREIEAAIDLGIRETLEALGSATYQEKLLPFIKGLEDVGETKKAEAVRRLLAVTSVWDADLIPALEQALNPLAVQGVNEAFRGRVVVVGRDLDQLYQALVRRKYTLAQTQKIFREWLKEEEISPSTFIHFLGREEAGGEASPVKERFPAFVEAHFQHLLPLLREAGPTPFKQALLISFWLEGYGLAAQKAAALFPFLEKMEPDKAVYSVAQLKRAAGLLAEKEPVLFEKIIEEVEKGEGFSAGIWRLLEEETAAAIFQKETLFSSILGEAFERLLASPEGGKPMEWPLPEAPPERQAPAAAFLAEKKRMAEVLKDCETIRQKLQLLKRREGNPPRDFKPWESLFIQHLSPLAYLLGTVPNRLERMGKGLPSIVRENIAEGEKICRLFFELFSRFYRQSLAGWEEGAGKRPRLVEDLPGRSLVRGLLPEGREGIFLLLDGMRWDLWEYLKEKFFAPLADQFRILQEGALWAHAPSSTSRQMEFFERALKEAGESGRGPEFRFWKFGGLDERVHTEKGSLEHLFGNVLQHLQLELAPSLRQLPPQTPLIVFSDHGFIENPHFEKSDKYRTPRYIHGESSPLEIIVPWAALVKM